MAFVVDVLLAFQDCSCHGSISGRELSFVPDVVHACAVGYHTARFVPGMRADALREWGSARSRSKGPWACGANSL